MRVIADTSVFMDAAQRSASLVQWLEANPRAVLLTSPVVQGELYALGRRKVGEMLKGVEIVPIDHEIGEMWGKLTYRLLREGSPMPANNLWVAATALALRVPVLSRDKGFSAVPDLESLSY